jgi:hypothetical protein
MVANPTPAFPLPLARSLSFAPGSIARRFHPCNSFFEFARVGIAALLIPQAPVLLWWMHTQSVLRPRGWIDAEYLTLLCVALLFPSWGAILVLTADLTVALVEPVAHLYYFSVADTFLSFRYLFLIPAHRLAAYIGLVIAYICACAAVLRLLLGGHRRPNAKKMAALLLLCGLLPLAADFNSGRFSRYLHAGPQPADSDLRREPWVRIPIASLLYGVLPGLRHTPDPPARSLTSALTLAIAELPATQPQPDIVLVLTESWGLSNDNRVNQAELQPYLTPEVGRLYRVQTGKIPFAGSTTVGETRELCGNTGGSATLSGPSEYFAACWPARLAKAGYRTLAVHGFTPTMFHRNAWYQRFGFQERAFLPTLEHDGATICDGAFPGACDADVARWIGGRLLYAHDAPTHDDRPLFVHWVTLNSHLPVAPLEDASRAADCVASGVGNDQSLCSWFIHVLRVHSSVAALALRPRHPTLFVIVGDHAPPFMRAEDRRRFSQTDVPFVILAPMTPRAMPLERATIAGPALP